MNVAIIAAAGRGARLASNRPKQFLELAGTPIIIHTLKPFELCDSIQEIIVVLPADQAAGFHSLVHRAGLRKVAGVVCGGATRAQSVARGLDSLGSEKVEIIAVHDGVRPFVTPHEITLTVEGARTSGAAILVSPLTDTVKEVRGAEVVRTVERLHLRKALTPQSFQYELLKKAYQNFDLEDPALTDDSFLVEQTGAKVMTIEGDPRNIKITTAADLALAEVMLLRS